jgi:hypothetical protein
VSDIYVYEIATAVRCSPSYLPAAAYGDDQWLRPLTHWVGEAAERLGHPRDALAYLHDTPDNDVAAQALALLGPARSAQPLYVSRSGGETDPFTAMLPRLVRDHDWVSDSLVLTHLEALTGSAVFEFLTWSLRGGHATVLLVDQELVAYAELARPSLTAVALRVGGTTGARVTGWGAGTPPADAGETSRTFGGTRACDAWAEFSQALAADLIVVDDTVLLHTVGAVQEGWVRLSIDELPLVSHPEPR